MSDQFYELEESIRKLLKPFPLFGEVLIHVERQITNTVETCAVTPKMQLLVNMDFFQKLTENQRLFVLAHEVMHLMNDHFFRFQEEWKKQPKICNVAMDCSINQCLVSNKKFPFEFIPGGVTLDLIKASCAVKMKAANLDPNTIEADRESEYYYDMLMKWAEEEQIPGEGDGHDKQFEDANSSSTMERKRLDNTIKKAIESQKQADMQRGTAAGDSILSVLPTQEKIDTKMWKRLVNKIIGETPCEETEYRYNVPSRKNINSIFGKKRLMFNDHVYVGIDTSGSVSDDDLSRFAGVLNQAMKKCGVVITLIECDFEVSHVEEKLKRVNSARGLTVHGRGGTDLTKILTWIEGHSKKKVNNLILLTDGDSPWRDSDKVKTSVIYTKQHRKMEGGKITAEAVLP